VLELPPASSPQLVSAPLLLHMPSRRCECISITSILELTMYGMIGAKNNKTKFDLDKKVHVFIQAVFRNVHLSITRIS